MEGTLFQFKPVAILPFGIVKRNLLFTVCLLAIVLTLQMSQFSWRKNLISTCSLDGSVALWSMNPLETIGFLPLLERDRKMLIVQGVEDEENKQPETWPIYGLCFCPKQLILVAVAQKWVEMLERS